ncbi:MAG: hypothetical protein K2W88_20940, partial [Pararheinheimera sp.]|nr:hypothetical protein [Rheinheimera sp.]
MPEFKSWLGQGDTTAPAQPEAVPEGSDLIADFGPLRLEKYSEKSVVIRGDTKANADLMKSLKGTFNPKLKGGGGWLFPATKADAVKQALSSAKLVAEPKQPTQTELSTLAKGETQTKAQQEAMTLLGAKAGDVIRTFGMGGVFQAGSMFTIEKVKPDGTVAMGTPGQKPGYFSLKDLQKATKEGVIFEVQKPKQQPELLVSAAQQFEQHKQQLTGFANRVRGFDPEFAQRIEGMLPAAPDASYKPGAVFMELEKIKGQVELKEKRERLAKERKELEAEQLNKPIKGRKVVAKAEPAVVAEPVKVEPAYTPRHDWKDNVQDAQAKPAFEVGDKVDVPNRTIGTSTIKSVYQRTVSGMSLTMAKIENESGKQLDVIVDELVPASPPEETAQQPESIKWFGTQDKADAWVSKQKDPAAYRVGQSGRNRFEIYQDGKSASNPFIQSNSQAVQDFIDGKRDDVPTADEVNAEIIGSIAQSDAEFWLDQIRSTQARLDEQGTVSDDRLESKLANAKREYEKAVKLETESKVKAAQAKPAESKLDKAADAISDKQKAAALKLKKLIDSRKGQLNSGVDPEVLLAVAEVGALSIAKGAVKFAQWVRDVINVTRAVGIRDEDVKPFLKESYGAMYANPEKYSISDDIADQMDNPRDARKLDIDSLTDADGDQSASLSDKLASKLADINDNVALKNIVAEHFGISRNDVTAEQMKLAQEALEAVLVDAARGIVAKGQSDKATYDSLVELYKNQPNLNVRSSTSMANMAYSTPAPLAFLASRLAGISGTTTVYEPTAGNGMLLIGAAPDNAQANELNSDRAAQLKDKGFTVTQNDATTYAPSNKVDSVIMNPPFGRMDNPVDFDGYKIKAIDHYIAAKALDTMKEDGRAVMIIGASKEAGDIGASDRVFFNWLYSNYNVTDHFEIDGDLYQRQGAGWPVRV